MNCYKDISSIWITNTIISCASIATLVLSSSDIQRHGNIAVVRESGPKDCRCRKSISCAVQMHFIILIHCLINRGVIDLWWSWRFAKENCIRRNELFTPSSILVGLFMFTSTNLQCFCQSLFATIIVFTLRVQNWRGASNPFFYYHRLLQILLPSVHITFPSETLLKLKKHYCSILTCSPPNSTQYGM